MDLPEVLNRIIQDYGKGIIAEKRFIYMIADYYSFRNNPAEKHVLSAIVKGGYSARLLSNENGCDTSVVTNQIIEEVCRLYGYRKDLVSDVIHNIAISLNLEFIKSSPVPSISVEEEQTEKENNKKLILNGDYSEGVIMGLYQELFGNYLHLGHAHMDAHKMMEHLGISISEANKLFCILVNMGAYKYNIYSRDYDINVSSPEMLRRKYRNYYNQYHELGTYSSLRINHGHVENAIKKLVIRRHTNIDLLREDLKEDKGEAEEILKKLYELKIINESGQLIAIYLTPNAIADKILKKMKKLT